jgi:hypothetical protein
MSPNVENYLTDEVARKLGGEKTDVVRKEMVDEA